MKLCIFVTPKVAVKDPPSETVQLALHHMGYQEVQKLILGKYLEVDLAEGVDPEVARKRLKEIAVRVNIFNPVIEDCRIEVGE